MLLTATGVGVLAFGLTGGWFLSRRVVRPIGVMSATAEAVSATHLSGRIQVDRVPSELGLLAQVLNAAFARLESAFLQQARFTADASHELRTPLSVIHSHAELSLSRERTTEEYRQTLAVCLKASSRMHPLSSPCCCWPVPMPVDWNWRTGRSTCGPSLRKVLYY